MVHQKNYFTQRVLLLTPFLLYLFVFTACNNEKSSDTQQTLTDTSTKAPEDTASGVENFEGSFKYLTIEKDVLKNLFEAQPQIEKLVFKFQFESPVSYPSLVGYGATSVRRFKDPKPLVTLTRSGFKVSLKGELFLGNLEMSRDEFNTLFKDGSGHENSTYLIFSPKISSQYKGNVIFGLSWDNGKQITEEYLKTLNFDEDELNPSPPARPEGSNEK